MDVRYDCRYFKGTMPCIPHKDYGVECNSNCEYLDSIDQNILEQSVCRRTRDAPQCQQSEATTRERSSNIGAE